MPRKKNSPKVKARAKARARANPPTYPRPMYDPCGNRNHSQFDYSHGYTLAEEARNTASNRRGNRGRDAKLRHQPVTFVSAGFMDPLKLLNLPGQPDQSVPPTETTTGPSGVGNIVTGASHARKSEESSARLANIDPMARLEQARSKDRQRDVGLDYSSDSSEEVILFRGRNAGSQKARFPSSPPIDSNAIRPLEINLPLQATDEMVEIAVKPDAFVQVEEPDYIALDESHQRRPRQSTSRKPHSMMNSDDDDEAAIIADYIANMQQGFDVDEDQNNDNDNRDSKELEHRSIGSYGFNILRDLGGTDSNAIPSQASSEDESISGSDGEQDIKSADERLARLITKTEEFGLETEEVLFLDGELTSDDNDNCDGDCDDGEGWLPAPRVHPRRKKGASKRSKLPQKGSQFPSATQMAEAFDAMDLMDLQNSRLQRSKKGTVSFGLSDSELEEVMSAAIKKDRRKKAAKKKAREELRSQGLLGRNVDPSDLRVKYRGGMSLDDLAEEVEAFLLSTREQLILPPFDKHARMVVHSIATNLRIKSKSAGEGVGRYPVLYRSKATLPYDRDGFNLAFSRVRRTWFPRVDVDRKVAQEARVLRGAEAPPSKGHRNGWSSLVLREGEIVGQHAAEIGVENKGRAMLEKMGWSKGMSLGTGETKGIIVPLTHVVKKSKAGLGEG